MSISIGINPLTWTNDDLPTLGAETLLSTCLLEGKKAGFAGFELGNKFPRTAQELGPILAEYQLRLVSGWFSGQLFDRTVEEEIQALKPHLTLLKSLGAKVIVYCEVDRCIHGEQEKGLLQRPYLADEKWVDFGAKLTKVADYCLEQGMQIAYHHHMGTIVQSEQDIDLLMEHTGDSVCLLLDTGHITYAGGDPISVFNKHKSRINHVHCKDIRANVLQDALNRNISFLDAMLNGVFTVPGDGCVDYPTLFNGLKNIDYTGWLVVEAEQDPSIAPPFEYALLGANNLKALAQNANINLAEWRRVAL